MPRKVFTAGEVLAAADVNNFLMDQAVQTFTDSTARESAVSTATAPAGLVTYLEDTDAFEYWDGTEYKTFGGGAVDLIVDYLVIAGGGGGGAGEPSGPFDGAGGGGAGGYLCSVPGETSGGGFTGEPRFVLLPSTNYTVSVGAGGSGASTPARGSNGVNSIFASAVAFGGGGGGSDQSGGGAKPNPPIGGAAGGSGGGASYDCDATSTVPGGAGTTNQGFAGGNNTTGCNAPRNGAGGGGAGSAGTNGAPSNGDGGSGVSSSITGTAVARAGGGGGGNTNGAGGVAVAGGGNGGSNTSGSGVAGSGNTGGGGGAGAGQANGANGGSGVVILRYPSAYTITIGAGLTGTTATVGSEKVTTITAGTGNISLAA